MWVLVAIWTDVYAEIFVRLGSIIEWNFNSVVAWFLAVTDEDLEREFLVHLILYLPSRS